jgi:hypothetical protein
MAKQTSASSGIRTRVSCLEGRNPDHWTNDAATWKSVAKRISKKVPRPGVKAVYPDHLDYRW